MSNTDNTSNTANTSNHNVDDNQRKQSLLNSMDKNQKRALFKSAISKVLTELSRNQSQTNQTNNHSKQRQSISVKTATKTKTNAKPKAKTALKCEKPVTQQSIAKTMVDIDIQCDIEQHFDNSEALNNLQFFNVSDEYSEKLYNQFLIENQQQNMIISELKQQLNSELNKLELKKANAARVVAEWERRISEAKQSNWCANCEKQIRESDHYLECCYDAIYCSRLCQMIDWRNGHQTSCTKK